MDALEYVTLICQETLSSLKSKRLQSGKSMSQHMRFWYLSLFQATRTNAQTGKSLSYSHTQKVRKRMKIHIKTYTTSPSGYVDLSVGVFISYHSY